MVHDSAINAAKPELAPRREARARSAAGGRGPVLIGILAAIGASLVLWAMIFAAVRALF